MCCLDAERTRVFHELCNLIIISADVWIIQLTELLFLRFLPDSSLISYVYCGRSPNDKSKKSKNKTQLKFTCAFIILLRRKVIMTSCYVTFPVFRSIRTVSITAVVQLMHTRPYKIHVLWIHAHTHAISSLISTTVLTLIRFRKEDNVGSMSLHLIVLSFLSAD